MALLVVIAVIAGSNEDIERGVCGHDHVELSVAIQIPHRDRLRNLWQGRRPWIVRRNLARQGTIQGRLEHAIAIANQQAEIGARLAVTRSAMPSPVRSPAATARAPGPAVETRELPKLPSPLPSRTLMELEPSVTTSSWPSPSSCRSKHFRGAWHRVLFKHVEGHQAAIFQAFQK